mmetsp:Transcript_3085/g.12532  ORF Transcript_3085/g.12532 Transcript_3085/m.12532 type:complete len:200 (+) Transcript_3085:2270-2869(+)
MPSSAIIRSTRHVPSGFPPCAASTNEYVSERLGTSRARMRSRSANAASRRDSVSWLSSFARAFGCTLARGACPLPFSGSASDCIACSYTSQRSEFENSSCVISSSTSPAAASATAPPPRQAPSAFTSVCASMSSSRRSCRETTSEASAAAAAGCSHAEHAAMAEFHKPRSGARGAFAPPASAALARSRTRFKPHSQSPA